MGRLIRYEYMRPGKRTMIFDQWLVHDDPDVKILLLDEHQGDAVRVGATTVLEPGAPALWYVFPGAWYDIGRFHLADGTFTGWYANICTPVEMRGDVWSSTDLFLDYWLPADGPGQWLDELEFVAALRDGLLDHRRGTKTADVRHHIDRQLAAGAWPPEVAREFSLGDARTGRAPPG